MKPFVAYVLEDNKNSGRITLNNADIFKLQHGLAVGEYSGLEVKVKKTGETVVFLPAYCCAQLNLNPKNFDVTRVWQFIDMRKAYAVLKEAQNDRS